MIFSPVPPNIHWFPLNPNSEFCFVIFYIRQYGGAVFTAVATQWGHLFAPWPLCEVYMFSDFPPQTITPMSVGSLVTLNCPEVRVWKVVCLYVSPCGGLQTCPWSPTALARWLMTPVTLKIMDGCGLTRSVPLADWASTCDTGGPWPLGRTWGCWRRDRAPWSAATPPRWQQ